VTVSPIIEGRDSQGAYRVPGSELHLVALQGQIADGADHTDTQSQRLAVRPAARRLGSLPSRTAARALSRSISSSGIWLTSNVVGAKLRRLAAFRIANHSGGIWLTSTKVI